MCHRKGDWSRTPSRASESDEEPEHDRTWWGSRAKDRLVTFVSTEEMDATDETPEADDASAEPMVEPKPKATAGPTESEVANEVKEDEGDTVEDDREEEPIPADD